MTRRSSLVLLLLAAGGCSSNDGPVDPVWAKQPCAECKMLVSDRRFAAQALLADGARLYFDDIGCLVQHLRGKQATRIWARDAVHDGWVDAESARYRSGALTPMNYGFEVDRESGDLRFDDVKREVLARRP